MADEYYEDGYILKFADEDVMTDCAAEDTAVLTDTGLAPVGRNKADAEDAEDEEIPYHPSALYSSDPQYLVSEIKAHRRRGRGFVFLVGWLGYQDEHDTWEPERNVNAELIAEYVSRVGGRDK